MKIHISIALAIGAASCPALTYATCGFPDKTPQQCETLNSPDLEKRCRKENRLLGAKALVSGMMLLPVDFERLTEDSEKLKYLSRATIQLSRYIHDQIHYKQRVDERFSTQDVVRASQECLISLKDKSPKAGALSDADKAKRKLILLLADRTIDDAAKFEASVTLGDIDQLARKHLGKALDQRASEVKKLAKPYEKKPCPKKTGSVGPVITKEAQGVGARIDCLQREVAEQASKGDRLELSSGRVESFLKNDFYTQADDSQPKQGDAVRLVSNSCKQETFKGDLKNSHLSKWLDANNRLCNEFARLQLITRKSLVSNPDINWGNVSPATDLNKHKAYQFLITKQKRTDEVKAALKVAKEFAQGGNKRNASCEFNHAFYQAYCELPEGGFRRRSVKNRVDGWQNLLDYIGVNGCIDYKSKYTAVSVKEICAETQE